MFFYTDVCINSLAYELPPHVVTSEEIENRLDSVYTRLKLPKGRLELMSGIKERRVWERGTRPSDAAAMAGKKAISQSDIPIDSIECLIFTSVSRDMMEPASASFVHNKLGLPEKCQVFDLSNACLGFLNGMVMLGNMIELGQVKNGLIVSGETAEELLESTINSLCSDRTLTRKTIKPAFASLTIGSGAVACIMSSGKTGKYPLQLVCGACRSNTSFVNLCHGGMQVNGNTLMETSSEELLIQGVDTARKTWQEFSSISGWSADEIDRFFCHQVGVAHAKLLFERLNLDASKNFETLNYLGNVGSVSAPITLAIALEEKAFACGQKGALLGIGSGINCMMLGVELGR